MHAKEWHSRLILPIFFIFSFSCLMLYAFREIQSIVTVTTGARCAVSKRSRVSLGKHSGEERHVPWRSSNTQQHPSQIVSKPRFMSRMTGVTSAALFPSCWNKRRLTLAVRCRTAQTSVRSPCTVRRVSLCALRLRQVPFLLLLWALSDSSSARLTLGWHWNNARSLLMRCRDL